MKVKNIPLIISLFSALFLTKPVYAESTLKLVIEQNNTDAKISVNAVCPSLQKKFLIEKIGDELGFAGKKRLKKITIHDGILPRFDLQEAFAEGLFKVSSLSDQTKSCNFVVVSVSKGAVEKGLPKIEKNGEQALNLGSGWVVVEDSKESPSTTSKTSKSSDTGTGDVFYENSRFNENGRSIASASLQSVCYRHFDITGYSRYSTGIVTWNRDNPAREGYSVKDELINSEYVSTLRIRK